MKSVNQQVPIMDPPSTSDSNSQNENEDLPPEKQLQKLKRFLKTIYQFSKDLSPAQRERVKELILNVVNQQITEQVFYTELQGSTKFPLRPYVVPFLQSSLPLLRTEFGSTSKENIESALFGEARSEPTVSQGGYFSRTNNNNNNNNNNVDNRSGSSTDLSLRKRKAGLNGHDHPISPKRIMSQSSTSPYPQLTSIVPAQNVSRFGNFFTSTTNIGNGIDSATLPSPIGATNGVALRSPTLANRPDLISNGAQHTDWWSSQNDEWRNVETLFTTMVATMERLRYAMLLFQQRAKLTQLWNEKFQLQQQRQQDSSLKIEEVKRKADAAVQEVKLAALTELQKAVLAAEQKALQMIAAERAQMEKLLRDTQHQENSIDNCWNCGRKAGQTCSGCGLARYCGVFCQHKDWSKHRTACGLSKSSSTEKPLNIKTEPEANALFLAKDRPSPKSV